MLIEPLVAECEARSQGLFCPRRGLCLIGIGRAEWRSGERGMVMPPLSPSNGGDTLRPYDGQRINESHRQRGRGQRGRNERISQDEGETQNGRNDACAKVHERPLISRPGFLFFPRGAGGRAVIAMHRPISGLHGAMRGSQTRPPLRRPN